MPEEFVNTKCVINSVNGRIDNAMANEKRTKGQIMIYKAMHRKLKIQQQKPTLHRR
jgi:hypothetical protein